MAFALYRKSNSLIIFIRHWTNSFQKQRGYVTVRQANSLPQSQCAAPLRSEEHTSELQSLMRISYAVFCFTKTNSSTSTRIYLNSITHYEVSLLLSPSQS